MWLAADWVADVAADWVADVADGLLVVLEILPITNHLSVTSVTPSAATSVTSVTPSVATSVATSVANY